MIRPPDDLRMHGIKGRKDHRNAAVEIAAMHAEVVGTQNLVVGIGMEGLHRRCGNDPAGRPWLVVVIDTD